MVKVKVIDWDISLSRRYFRNHLKPYISIEKPDENARTTFWSIYLQGIGLMLYVAFRMR